MIAVQQRPDGSGGVPAGLRALGVAWGIGGIGVVLVYAAASLGAYAVQAVAGGLSPSEWFVLTANTAVMAWLEGYRGFQLRFSPRVAARALHLYEHPSWPRLLLAPLFCAGYFGATVRLRRTIWIGTGLILIAILVFNRLPQPWRGILDAGVMVGLIWGTASLLLAARTTFRERRALVAAEVAPGMGASAGL